MRERSPQRGRNNPNEQGAKMKTQQEILERLALLTLAANDNTPQSEALQAATGILVWALAAKRVSKLTDALDAMAAAVVDLVDPDKLGEFIADLSETLGIEPDTRPTRQEIADAADALGDSEPGIAHALRWAAGNDTAGTFPQTWLPKGKQNDRQGDDNGNGPGTTEAEARPTEEEHDSGTDDRDRDIGADGYPIPPDPDTYKPG